MTKDKKMGQEQSKTWFKELKDMTAMEIFSLSPTAIIDEGNTAEIEDKAEASTSAERQLNLVQARLAQAARTSQQSKNKNKNKNKKKKADGEVGINKDAWSHGDIKKLLKHIEEFSHDYEKVFACFSHKTEEEFRPVFNTLAGATGTNYKQAMTTIHRAGTKKGKKRSGKPLRNPSPRKKTKLPLALRRLENSPEWDESNNPTTFICYSFHKQDGTLVIHTCRLDSLLIVFSTIEEERKATNRKSLLSWIDKSNPQDKEIHDALELAFDYLENGDTAMGREVFSSLIDKDSESNWYGDMNDALTRIFKPIIGPILTCKCECEKCAHVVEHGLQHATFMLTDNHPRGFFGSFREY